MRSVAARSTEPLDTAEDFGFPWRDREIVAHKVIFYVPGHIIDHDYYRDANESRERAQRNTAQKVRASRCARISQCSVSSISQAGRRRSAGGSPRRRDVS